MGRGLPTASNGCRFLCPPLLQADLLLECGRHLVQGDGLTVALQADWAQMRLDVSADPNPHPLCWSLPVLMGVFSVSPHSTRAAAAPWPAALWPTGRWWRRWRLPGLRTPSTKRQGYFLGGGLEEWGAGLLQSL